MCCVKWWKVVIICYFWQWHSRQQTGQIWFQNFNLTNNIDMIKMTRNSYDSVIWINAINTVFCFINWHRSDRNLVQQVELLYIWGYIRHNHFAAVGCVDQELIRYCLVFILLTLAILPCISMGHHEVLLEVNLYILDFFLEHNKITSSCDCQSSRLICLSLVVSALQSWRQWK